MSGLFSIGANEAPPLVEVNRGSQSIRAKLSSRYKELRKQIGKYEEAKAKLERQDLLMKECNEAIMALAKKNDELKALLAAKQREVDELRKRYEVVSNELRFRSRNERFTSAAVSVPMQ